MKMLSRHLLRAFECQQMEESGSVAKLPTIVLDRVTCKYIAGDEVLGAQPARIKRNCTWNLVKK